MPFTKFTNLDFDQIKTSIKDYLRANSTFTDFDFEGSNFSILIDTLAYNTYITAFNSNMVVNESFLDSATVRENVVSLARNIGYVPRSKTAATARISFTANFGQSIDEDDDFTIATLKAGLACIGNANETNYVLSTSENISAPVVKQETGGTLNYIASFENIEVKEGTFLTRIFNVNTSLDQRFILNNKGIDTSTIKVYVKGSNESGLGSEYSLVENILNIQTSLDVTTEIYNSFGQLVVSATREKRINLQHLSKGLYHVVIRNNGRTSIKKIIKVAI